ncbi:hypothetical protein Tco_0223257 [Tanacetum coccineum]
MVCNSTILKVHDKRQAAFVKPNGIMGIRNDHNGVYEWQSSDMSSVSTLKWLYITVSVAPLIAQIALSSRMEPISVYGARDTGAEHNWFPNHFGIPTCRVGGRPA